MTLKLRVEHLGRQHKTGARKHVFGHELDALWQQAVQFNEALDRREQTIAQTAVVRAACGGGNKVDIAFANRLTIFCKCHRPTGAFTFCKAVVVAVCKAFIFKQRNDGVAIQSLHEVIAQSGFVLPSLGLFGFFVEQGHCDTGHEHRFAAQQMRELGHGQDTRFKILGIGPHTHRGALLAIALCSFSGNELFNHIAARKRQCSHLTFTVADGFQTLGKCIGHTDTYAMQAA